MSDRLIPIAPPSTDPVPGRQSKRRPRRLRALPRPQLTIEQILAWADDEHERTGRWPSGSDGAVRANRNEKWANINASLGQGNRGLPGGSSVAKLLAEHRGVRNLGDLPRLSEEQILAWADAYYRRTGKWLGQYSGPVDDAPGETWPAIQGSLQKGVRGLPGGDTIRQLLLQHGRG